MFIYSLSWGVGAFSVSQMIKDPPAMREAWAPSLSGGETPCSRAWQPLQCPCLENPWTEGPLLQPHRTSQQSGGLLTYFKDVPSSSNVAF